MTSQYTNKLINPQLKEFTIANKDEELNKTNINANN